MTDTSKCVEDWYHNNAKRIAASFPKAEFNKRDWDPIRGGVTIDLEGPTVVANLSFWYKGDVSVSVLKRESETPVYFDDRKLSPDEDVSSLLDGYFSTIEKLA